MFKELNSNSADPCVFIKKENDRTTIVADDLIMHTKDMFANQFKMKATVSGLVLNRMKKIKWDPSKAIHNCNT